MKFAVTIICPRDYPHWKVFLDTAEVLHAGLGSLGHDSVLTYDLSLTDHRYIVLGSNLLPFSDVKSLPEGAILYNLEQYHGWENEWMRDPRYVVWDYDERNTERLNRMGIKPAAILPVGYHPVMEKVPQHEWDRDIDVLFIGSISPRRMAILNALIQDGLRVKHLFNCYESERDAWIARSRIHLNVHFNESAVYEWPRLMYLMANRCVVVSESDLYRKPAPGGVLVYPYDALVDEISWLARRPESMLDSMRDVAHEMALHRPIEPLLHAALGKTP